MKIKVGNKYRLYGKKKGNPNKKTIHVILVMEYKEEPITPEALEGLGFTRADPEDGIHFYSKQLRNHSNDFINIHWAYEDFFIVYISLNGHGNDCEVKTIRQLKDLYQLLTGKELKEVK